MRPPSALHFGLHLLHHGSPVDATASGEIPSALLFSHKVAAHYEHRCSLALVLQPGSELEDQEEDDSRGYSGPKGQRKTLSCCQALDTAALAANFQ